MGKVRYYLVSDASKAILHFSKLKKNIKVDYEKDDVGIPAKKDPEIIYLRCT